VGEYNFTNLGLENITCGNMTLLLDNNGKPVQSDAFNMSGVWNHIPQIGYYLTLYAPMVDQNSIVVKSKYNDISVEITKSANGRGYDVVASRKGMAEKITYFISFLNVSKP
jgi:hypothetical protein